MSARHLFAVAAVLCAVLVLLGVDVDAFKLLAVGVIFAAIAAVT